MLILLCDICGRILFCLCLYLKYTIPPPLTIPIDYRALGHNDTLPACAFGSGHNMLSAK